VRAGTQRQGENVVLLAYGAAGTGKSYTLQGATASGSLPDTAQDAGMILRAAFAVVRGLSAVPKSRYALSVTHCGLSVGLDAQLVDLLAPGSGAAASTTSLRDGSAAAALAGLTSWAVEDPCDITEALRCRRLLGNGNGRGGGRRSLHTLLTLTLDSFAADGSLLQRNSLSFVELAAPEPKVGGAARA
jgi:kinesin family protein 4/21/27